MEDRSEAYNMTTKGKKMVVTLKIYNPEKDDTHTRRFCIQDKKGRCGTTTKVKGSRRATRR